jgi:hypothetical protein
MNTNNSNGKISLEFCAAAMVTLGERFARSVSAPLIRIYHDALAQALRLEQLEKAVRVVCIEDTFFPSPARLIEAATGNIDDAARVQWDESIAAHHANRRAELDSFAKSAWHSLGGREYAFSSQMDASRLLKLREQFLHDYAARARAERVNALALPSVKPPSVKPEAQVA